MSLSLHINVCLNVNKWKKKEEQTGITYKDTILKRREVTFTFQRTVGVSLQRREIGPTQVCAFHHTADDTRLTEKISSSVRRNSLFLSRSLSTSSQRQSVRQRFSCVSLPSMNVTECECARAASRAHVKWSWGIVLAPGAEEQPPRGEDAKCVCACLCVYTDHWLRSYKDERVHCVEERIASVEGNSDSLVHIFVLTPEHHTRVSWQVNPGLSDVHASLTLREPRIDTYFLFSFYTHFKIAFMMPL